MIKTQKPTFIRRFFVVKVFVLLIQLLFFNGRQLVKKFRPLVHILRLSV